MVPVLTAFAVVGYRQATDPVQLTVTVSGGGPARAVDVQEGTSVAELLALAGVSPTDGRLLSAGSGAVLDAHLEPAELVLDGRRVTPTSLLGEQAKVLRVVDGADAVEPTRTEQVQIAVPEGPEILRSVEERGAPGRAVRVVGVHSGEVVSEDVVVAARAPVPTARKVVALTFDDGPSAAWTPYVLAILRSRGVKATFCLVGSAVEKEPEVARQVVADGHQLCNHTQGHDEGLASAPQSRVDEQVEGGRAAIVDHQLPAPAFYRPPGGYLSDAVIATAKAQGERVLLWKVDTKDWQRSATTESVMANLRSQIQPGAIVLLHDAGGSNRHTSLAVLAGLIDELRAQGYEFTFPVIDPPA